MQPLTDEERLQKAEQASTLAILNVVLVAVGSCGASFALLLVLPLALWGIYLAKLALEDDTSSDLVRAYALPARTIHLTLAIFSSLWILFFFAILLLYGGLFVALIAGA